MIHGDTDAAMAILASNILEEMDESFAGIPPAILHHVANELVSFPEEQCQPKAEAEAEASHRTKRRRNHFKAGPLEEANWYLRYLSTPRCIENAKNPQHPRGIEFRRNFAVPFEIYEKLLDLTLAKGWYDPSRKSATGRPCSNIRLLLLGVLHVQADNASKYACQTNTNISVEVHCQFNLKWWRDMASIKDEFIKMPDNRTDAENIALDFDNNGLPGCCGSMDVVHRGWDQYPSELTPIFKGKEGYAAVAFQVIVSHRKKILHVSLGYPGARNDKQIVKVDSFPKSLHNGSHWLRTQVWFTKKNDGTVEQHRGFWLLVDGGYLRWPSLICPVRYDTCPNVRMLAKHLESIRKDVECSFGSLKKLQVSESLVQAP
jgi:hypothetical protein